MDLNDLRKVTAEDLSHMPDGVKVYVECNARSAIDTGWFTGWYKKYAHHVQNENGGFIDIEDTKFDFYVKFSYSLPTAQQILFEVATELHTGFEGLDKDVLSEKIYDVIREIDRMELW